MQAVGVETAGQEGHPELSVCESTTVKLTALYADFKTTHLNV